MKTHTVNYHPIEDGPELLGARGDLRCFVDELPEANTLARLEPTPEQLADLVKLLDDIADTATAMARFLDS